MIAQLVKGFLARYVEEGRKRGFTDEELGWVAENSWNACRRAGYRPVRLKDIVAGYHKRMVENRNRQNKEDMDKKKLKELGWKQSELWNGRLIFTLPKAPGYSVFEHGGEYGITNPFNSGHFVYCNPTDEELEEFTRLAERMANIEAHPDKVTLSEARAAKSEMKEFAMRMRGKAV